MTPTARRHWKIILSEPGGGSVSDDGNGAGGAFADVVAVSGEGVAVCDDSCGEYDDCACSYEDFGGDFSQYGSAGLVASGDASQATSLPPYTSVEEVAEYFDSCSDDSACESNCGDLVSTGCEDLKGFGWRYANVVGLDDAVLPLPTAPGSNVDLCSDFVASDLNYVVVPSPAVVASLLSRWFPTLHTSHLALDLHPNTLTDLAQATLPPCGSGHVIVHVEGSGGAHIHDNIMGPVAWSFNAVEVQGEARAYAGFYGGHVVTDPAGSRYIGADQGTNATSELSGIGVACVWALQSSYSSIHIVYDAVYAASMATGAWGPTCNVEVVDFVMEMVCLLSQVMSVTWEHVYSHEGHGLNELADTGATVYSVGRLRSDIHLPPLLADPANKPLLP